MKKEFKILDASISYSLAKKVNEALKDGWDLRGTTFTNICKVFDRNDFYQVITKGINNDENF